MNRALQDLDGIYDCIAHTAVFRIDEAKKTVIVVTVRYSPSEF